MRLILLVLTLSRLCVFNVQWSPIVPHFLLSGSDDSTARVWNITTEKCTMELKGHTNKIRGLMWHRALEFVVVTGSNLVGSSSMMLLLQWQRRNSNLTLLFLYSSLTLLSISFLGSSGSWDATVRIWDIRDGSSMICLSDHLADVYGIASHPERPFLIVTSSRDTTLRLWNLTHLFPELLVHHMQLCSPKKNSEHMKWVIKSKTFEKLWERCEGIVCKLDRLTLISNYFMMPGACPCLPTIIITPRWKSCVSQGKTWEYLWKIHSPKNLCAVTWFAPVIIQDLKTYGQWPQH